ncbi:MAG: hypothetical protein A3K19_29475 [Lentisphaerae bacterium RIFOXYB12_FULL_65_16]|nr:MAG: hypothetical protein A3K18_33230 [Lentisphaerae bacterium RIFOXYA12_64_32]OGV88287.1 MAG: hypothetical protein A3K19_29475 [Lentisphaerae bacterium RIFOXYB12_FULL_65_16]
MKSFIAQYFLNHRLDPAEIEWQMQEFAAQGYEGVYAHARPGMLTPYMSEEWWQALDAILAACKRHGLEFWIWDEDYYPSGLCGGRVVWTEPGLAARRLEFTVVQVDGTQPVQADFAPGLLLRAFAIEHKPDGTYGAIVDVTRFCGTRRQKWPWRQQLHRAYSPLVNRIGHPHWRTAMDDNRFALVWTPDKPASYTICAAMLQNLPTTHPDILRPEGIALFLKLSYEPYAERYGAELGRSIHGAFTDEPSPGAGTYPWTATFPAEFATDHGYDLNEHLPHLVLDVDARSPMVRHHYRLTQHRLQKAHYVEQVAQWCRQHGIRMAGHLTRTEWLTLVAAWWPNELRCYEPMDIPCCDPLGASEGWPDAAAYHTGVKVASSAAHLFGKTQAGCDSLAVIGDEASIRDLKYHLDYQMVLGINHFTVHGLSYSNDGNRKDEVPPSIFYQHTEWQHMKALTAHLATTCAALTGGRHVCELALLYPSTSLACQLKPGPALANGPLLPDEERIHELVEALLSHQRDFDFIDEVAVQTQVDDTGRIHTAEACSVIVLPHLRFIDQATAQGLLRFAKAGGRVLAVGTMPQAISRDLNAPLTDWATPSIEFHTALDEQALARLPGATVRGDGARDVFVLKRERDGHPIVFAFNRREAWFDGEVEGLPMRIPPRGGVLRGQGQVEPAPRLLEDSTTALDLSGDWQASFEPNHMPLSFWHVSTSMAQPLPVFEHGTGYDLMRREPDPAGKGDNPVRYYCRFMLTGAIADARLVIDDSTIAGQWRVLVNGVPIEGWTRARISDCRNLEAPVGHALRAGSTPTLNVVVVETSGPGRGLCEVPHLYGSFTCEYRYGHLSYPFVRGAAGDVSLPGLQPWDVLGYPTYSGSAVYRRRLCVETAGDYVLDLGRVEDVAVVSVASQEATILAWPPYRCLLKGLQSGAHDLVVAVSNPPANRNRAAGLASGLLGPVRIWRLPALVLGRQK